MRASVTVPVNPLIGVIVIVVAPALPALTSIRLEVADMPKSESIGVTVTATTVVCTSEPLVPVILTV